MLHVSKVKTSTEMLEIEANEVKGLFRKWKESKNMHS